MNQLLIQTQEPPVKVKPVRYATFKFPLLLAKHMAIDRMQASGYWNIKRLNFEYLKDTLDRYCHHLADLPREGYLFYGPDAVVSMLYVLPD